jgi:hypothetical protein
MLQNKVFQGIFAVEITNKLQDDLSYGSIYNCD